MNENELREPVHASFMTDARCARLLAHVIAAALSILVVAVTIANIFLLSSCCLIWPTSKFWGCPSACYSTWFSNVGGFEVKPNAKTSKGVKVDIAQGLKVDLVAMDGRLDKIESCLQGIPTFVLTEEQRQAWSCPMRAWKPAPLKRECLEIKVVHAVGSSCHPEWQFIDALAPEASCTAKGLQPTPECPCRWRAGIVDEYKIVTPPAMYLWNVTYVATACSNPWGTAALPSPFAACMGPGYGY